MLRGNKSVSGGETAALIWLELVRRLAVRDGNDGEHKNPLLRFGEGKGEVDGNKYKLPSNFTDLIYCSVAIPLVVTAGLVI